MRKPVNEEILSGTHILMNDVMTLKEKRRLADYFYATMVLAAHIAAPLLLFFVNILAFKALS